MQSLKDLALICVSENTKVKVIFQTKKCVVFLAHERKKMWYIHDLLDVINNRTKFHLNRIRTYKFHLKLFDTSVTLRYIQGQRKWHKWVKLNEYYHHTKYDNYHIHSVREIATLKFCNIRTLGPPAWHWPLHRLTFFTRVKNGNNNGTRLRYGQKVGLQIGNSAQKGGKTLARMYFKGKRWNIANRKVSTKKGTSPATKLPKGKIGHYKQEGQHKKDEQHR